MRQDEAELGHEVLLSMPSTTARITRMVDSLEKMPPSRKNAAAESPARV